MNAIEHGNPLPDGKGTVVLSTSGLVYGDQIEAFYKGTLVHRGHVTDIAPNHELFWIMDHLTGSRRLLDIVEFQIVRTGAPEGAGGTLASTAAG
jgi:hypothetical protein